VNKLGCAGFKTRVYLMMRTSLLILILVSLNLYPTIGIASDNDVLVLTHKKNSDKIEMLKPGDKVLCVLEDSLGQGERIKGIITGFDAGYIIINNIRYPLNKAVKIHRREYGYTFGTVLIPIGILAFSLIPMPPSFEYAIPGIVILSTGVYLTSAKGKKFVLQKWNYTVLNMDDIQVR
jgi:hypothetical protein